MDYAWVFNIGTFLIVKGQIYIEVITHYRHTVMVASKVQKNLRHVCPCHGLVADPAEKIFGLFQRTISIPQPPSGKTNEIHPHLTEL